MKILRDIISACIFLFYHSTNAQTRIFLGELKLGYKNYLRGGFDTKIPHKLFVNNWDLRIYVDKGNGEKGEEIKLVKLLPKEDWYSQYNEEIKKVEVVIEIPDDLLSNYRKDSETGNMNLIGEIWSKNPTKFYGNIKQRINISWWKHNSNNNKDYNYINQRIFKLKEPISIASPAAVGLKLAVDFVKTALDSTSDEIPQYLSTIRELENVINKSATPIEISYFQFFNFSKLLIFLEPYIAESSFLNMEAKELKYDIQSMSDTLANLKTSSKNSDSTKTYFTYRIKSNIEIYSEYQLTINRLKGYYSNLQLILYNKNYEAKFPVNRNLTTHFQKKNLLPIDAKQLSVAFGYSFLYGLRPLYNVTLSNSNNIVQFESISRFHTILSCGIFWSPKISQNDSTLKNNKVYKQSKKGDFSFGLLSSYSIIPNKSQLLGTNPMGLGLGIGYKRQNLGIYISSNFKLIKQPRQYFINQYKDKNLTLSSLEISNSRIFVNKTEISLGISLLYFLNFRSIFLSHN